MRTTAERLAAAKRRARELERERQRRRARGLLCAGTAACLVVIVSLALVMPGITEGFSDTALGVGMDLRQRYGRMIVDMGAGITDIAVISEGEIVQSSSVYYAGDYFDDAIVRYIRKKYSLLIGERTAEQIKISIGTAMKPETDEANLAMPVVGRNQLSGLPRTQEIHAAEIYEALKDPVAALIGSIQDVLVRTPPQLASDIFDDGIVLSGGAAGLARLPEAIYTALHIPCGVADDPQTSVVLGCGIAVEDPGAYASLLDDGRKGFKRL